MQECYLIYGDFFVNIDALFFSIEIFCNRINIHLDFNVFKGCFAEHVKPVDGRFVILRLPRA